MSCDLYRFYDVDEKLLYVGISLNAAARAAQHRAEKSWWPEVARMDVEQLPSREDALIAERAAITSERPLHNIVGNRCRRIHRGFEIGSVYAFGLDVWVNDVGQWRCPVGLITRIIKPSREHPHPAYEVDLYSWWSHYFGHMSTVIGREWINASLRAESHNQDGESVFAMDPLGDFQVAWQRRPAP